MLVSIMYPDNKIFPVAPKQSSVIANCFHSPTMKRRRFTTLSTVKRSSHDEFHGDYLNSYSSLASSSSPNGSTRLNAVRHVSDLSMVVLHDSPRSTVSGENGAKVAVSFTNSLDILTSKAIDRHLSAVKNCAGSCLSSAASLSRIHDVIQRLKSIIGSGQQSQQDIADQCYYLSSWTKINTTHHMGKNCQPTASTNLTLYQVALSIVSNDGINSVLNAMATHPHNTEIQEHGCLSIGNIFALLYCRKRNNLVSYEKYLTDTNVGIGSTVVNQIIRTMHNHPHNVAVHCAAIPALQQYYLSVLVFQQNDSIKECQKKVLRNAQEMFLPSKIRDVLKSTIDVVERMESICR